MGRDIPATACAVIRWLRRAALDLSGLPRQLGDINPNNAAGALQIASNCIAGLFAEYDGAALFWHEEVDVVRTMLRRRSDGAWAEDFPVHERLGRQLIAKFRQRVRCRRPDLSLIRGTLCVRRNRVMHDLCVFSPHECEIRFALNATALVSLPYSIRPHPHPTVPGPTLGK